MSRLPLDCCRQPATTVEAVLLHEPHDGLSVLRCRCGRAWLARMRESIHWRPGAEDDIDMWYSPLSDAEASSLAAGGGALGFLRTRPSIHVSRGRTQAVTGAPVRPVP